MINVSRDHSLNFRNAFLAALSADDIQALGPDLIEVSYQRGDTLFEVGAVADDVVFPSSAVISIVTVMKDSRCVETSTIGHESGVSLLDAATNDKVRSRIFAQVGGAAMTLSATALRRRLSESAGLMQLFLQHARANALQSEQHVACNMLHDIDQRLAKWLLMTADRVGGDRFMLTQDYMAVMTGSQRTTVSATAARLKAAGLVSYTRGQVAIQDRAGLERRACECYGETKSLFENLRAREDA